HYNSAPNGAPQVLDWGRIWLWPCLFAAAVLAVFIVGFKDDVGQSSDARGGGAGATGGAAGWAWEAGGSGGGRGALRPGRAAERPNWPSGCGRAGWAPCNWRWTRSGAASGAGTSRRPARRC